MYLPTEPEESGRPERASAGGERLSPKSRELPDPDERRRVYEATRAHAAAEAAERLEEVSGSGQRFEVQFHTPESFHAKQNITHTSYERIRNPLTSDGERMELRKFQREVSAAIGIPDAVAEIPDHKKEGF